MAKSQDKTLNILRKQIFLEGESPTSIGFNQYLNLFSETNYEKQTNILFSFYHSLALYAYSWDIMQVNLKKSLDLELKKKIGLPCWAQINFIIYWTWIWKIL